jgi:NAD(P)-dependent dehydrogenase (short-subunit alcohol dehydrogenase family)
MRILVIGANQGLGLCLARLFVDKGHDVFAGYRRQPSEALSKLAAECTKLKLAELDVTSEAQVEKAARAIDAEGGKLDALVLTAGVLTDSDRTRLVTETDIGDLRAALEVNVVGTANVVKHFHKLVKDGGTFIVVTSEAGSVTNNGEKYPGYSISKAAQNKLTAIFAKTVTAYRVYALHPGRMNTVMGRNDAQIEPEESAAGIYSIITGEKQPDAGWFINYKGEGMEI